MQQAPGKHLQSHSQLNFQAAGSPDCKGECQERGRGQESWAAAALQAGHSTRPAIASPASPVQGTHAVTVTRAFFEEEGEKRRVKYEGILHCGAVCHKGHEIALKTQGRNANKKYPP